MNSTDKFTDKLQMMQNALSDMQKGNKLDLIVQIGLKPNLT